MNAIPNTWSFSRWQTHQQCPLKYKLQFVDKLPVEQSAAMARGNKVHLGIAAYLTGEAGAMPAEVKTPFHQQLVMEIADNHRDTAMVEQKWGFTARWTGAAWMGRDVWLRAIADVALCYGDGTAEVIDWKTGKKYGHNDDQVELFALTTMAKFHNEARRVTTRLVYIDAGSEEIAEHDAKDFDKLRDKWSRNAEVMLADRQFFPRPNDKCKFCSFARSAGGPCRHG